VRNVAGEGSSLRMPLSVIHFMFQSVLAKSISGSVRNIRWKAKKINLQNQSHIN